MNIIQEIYNSLKHLIKRNVFRMVNNCSTEVMITAHVRNSIWMDFTSYCNDEGSEIDEFKEPMTKKNLEVFMKHLHVAWCYYL